MYTRGVLVSLCRESTQLRFSICSMMLLAVCPSPVLISRSLEQASADDTSKEMTSDLVVGPVVPCVQPPGVAKPRGLFSRRYRYTGSYPEIIDASALVV